MPTTAVVAIQTDPMVVEKPPPRKPTVRKVNLMSKGPFGDMGKKIAPMAKGNALLEAYDLLENKMVTDALDESKGQAVASFHDCAKGFFMHKFGMRKVSRSSARRSPTTRRTWSRRSRDSTTTAARA